MIENEIFWYIVNFMATTIEELVLVKIFDIYSKRKQNTSIVYSLIFIPIIMVQIFTSPFSYSISSFWQEQRLMSHK